MNIGEQIKHIRLSHGITQETLAELSGISLPAIRKYENGERNPKFDQLIKISSALEVSVNMFIDFDIKTISDVFSLIFKMNDQLDLDITADRKENGSYDPDTVSISFKNKIINQNLCTYLEALDKKNSLSATTQITELMQAKASLDSMKQHLLNDNTMVNSNNHLTDTFLSKGCQENLEAIEDLQKLLLTAKTEDKKWATEMIKLISQKLK